MRGDIPGAKTAVRQVEKIPDFPYAWDQLVTRSGRQVQNMPLRQDRPLDATELAKVEREGVCVACHRNYATPTWDKVRAQLRRVLNAEGRAPRPEDHDRAVEIALKALAEAAQPQSP